MKSIHPDVQDAWYIPAACGNKEFSPTQSLFLILLKNPSKYAKKCCYQFFKQLNPGEPGITALRKCPDFI
jgi:hypothetical protein